MIETRQTYAIALALLLAGPAAAAPGCTAWGDRGALLYADDLATPLTSFVAEYAHKPGNVVASRDGRMEIDVDGGATVWFDRPLQGDVVISYTRRVVMAGGRNDRLSDLNQFWMARDPKQASLFTRNGTFEQYDDLDLYYVGMGGNTNTTTRLRRYGNGQRVLVQEYTDKAHLLQPNRDYRIEIAVYHGCTRMLVDGEEWFNFRDPQPLTQGYFGYRATWSHQTIADLKIYQLK